MRGTDGRADRGQGTVNRGVERLHVETSGGSCGGGGGGGIGDQGDSEGACGGTSLSGWDSGKGGTEGEEDR